VFAPRVARSKSKAAKISTSRLVPHRATLVGHRPGHDPVEQTLFLQRAIGNQATLRLLARQGPVLSRNGRNNSEEQKIVIGQANDPLEQEADRIADQVMRMPDANISLASGMPQLSRKCAACEQEEGEMVRPKAAAAANAGAGKVPGIVREVLRSPGQPLDTESRAFFEPRFGRDFANIRIHADHQAARSAQSVNALAYATGSHIVFGSGQYSPGTSAGKALLAHELAHAVQQAKQNSAGEVISRRVARVNCRANEFGAPDDPRGALEGADQTGIDLANQMAQGLAADAQTVRDGIPDAPSATLQAYENHFGLPVPAGAGFLNRMTGVVRPTQEIALSEELAVVSRRFALVARLMGQGLSYTCPGNAPLTLVGCSAGTCDGADAFSCPGNSLMALCESFWTNFDDTGRAQVIVHEGFHIAFGNIGIGSILDATTTGPGRNFNIAGCYEALIADQTGVQTATCPDVPGA
jgi:hypothetical protein